MNTETSSVEQPGRVQGNTPVWLRYAAVVLVVLLPFLGGWIGYVYAPEEVPVVSNETANQEIQFIDSFERSLPDRVHELFFRVLATSLDGTKEYMFETPYENLFSVPLLYRDMSPNHLSFVGPRDFAIYRTDPELLIKSNTHERDINFVSSDGKYLAVEALVESGWYPGKVCEPTEARWREFIAVVDMDTSNVFVYPPSSTSIDSYQFLQWIDSDTVVVSKDTYVLPEVSSDMNQKCLELTNTEELTLSIPSDFVLQ